MAQQSNPQQLQWSAGCNPSLNRNAASGAMKAPSHSVGSSETALRQATMGASSGISRSNSNAPAHHHSKRPRHRGRAMEAMTEAGTCIAQPDTITELSEDAEVQAGLVKTTVCACGAKVKWKVKSGSPVGTFTDRGKKCTGPRHDVPVRKRGALKIKTPSPDELDAAKEGIAELGEKISEHAAQQGVVVESPVVTSAKKAQQIAQQNLARQLDQEPNPFEVPEDEPITVGVDAAKPGGDESVVFTDDDWGISSEDLEHERNMPSVQEQWRRQREQQDRRAAQKSDDPAFSYSTVRLEAGKAKDPVEPEPLRSMDAGITAVSEDITVTPGATIPGAVAKVSNIEEGVFSSRMLLQNGPGSWIVRTEEGDYRVQFFRGQVSGFEKIDRGSGFGLMDQTGKILALTVSETRRGAMVNALETGCNVSVYSFHTDEQIEFMFIRSKPRGSRIVPIRFEPVEEDDA